MYDLFILAVCFRCELSSMLKMFLNVGCIPVQLAVLLLQHVYLLYYYRLIHFFPFEQIFRAFLKFIMLFNTFKRKKRATKIFFCIFFIFFPTSFLKRQCNRVFFNPIHYIPPGLYFPLFLHIMTPHLLL